MEFLSESSCEALFFCGLPNNLWQQLVAFDAFCRKETSIELVHPSCLRELIFTEPEILISPSMSVKNKLFIISKVEKIHSKEFLQNLKRLEVELGSRITVTKELFQYCLVFTLMHRIAPSWNRLGEFLVQGKNFFEERRKLNAVRLVITVLENQICISLRPLQIKLPSCEIRDFIVVGKALQMLSADSDFLINQSCIEERSCFLMPSMNRGSIFSISKKIPMQSPFKSYAELRKHWKLMYGMHLPSSECSEYYNVSVFTDRIFTRCNKDLIYQSFLKDLVTRLPSICGIAVKLNRTALFPKAALFEANMQGDFVYSKKLRDNSGQIRFDGSDNSDTVFQSAQVEKSLRDKAGVGTNSGTSTKTSCSATKVVPLFSKRTSFSRKVRPSHKTERIKNSRLVDVTCPITESVETRKDVPTKILPNTEVHGKRDGIMCPSTKRKSVFARSSSRPSKPIHGLILTGKSNENNDQNHLIDTKPVNESSLLDTSVYKNSAGENQTSSVRKSDKDGIGVTGGKRILEARNGRQYLAMNLAKEIILQAEMSQKYERKSGHEIKSGIGLKRDKKLEISENDESPMQPMVKKARAKICVQGEIDIPSLAKKRQLKKANIATLRFWLTEQGVKINTTTKKDELINKINYVLNISIPEN